MMRPRSSRQQYIGITGKTDNICHVGQYELFCAEFHVKHLSRVENIWCQFPRTGHLLPGRLAVFGGGTARQRFRVGG
jgi:hypothetical protein